MTIELNDLQLVPPLDFQNTFDVTLSSVMGTDTQQCELSGTLQATLDLDVSSGEPAPIGLTLADGRNHRYK